MQVLTAAPAVGLPWPPGKLQRVAAPQEARPQLDMPLVSGSMRILDGECRLAQSLAQYVFDPGYKGSELK